MKLKLTTALAVLPVLTVIAASPALAECEPAVWDLVTSDYSGSGEVTQSNATSTRLCLADGALQVDEYRSLNENGEPVFWGVTLQPTMEGPGETHILWLMVGDSGYTIIPLTVHEDGSHSAEGRGRDARGEFRERSETTFSEDGSYHFVMSRSYNRGRRWIEPFNVIDAQMTDRQPGPRPTELAPIIAEATDVIPEDYPRGTPILDGAAELRTFERRGHLVVQFGSRYWGPDRWRVVEWVVGDDEVSIGQVQR